MAISSWVPPLPPNPDDFKNPPPFAPHPLIHFRAGKVKVALGKDIETGIFKKPIFGPVEITRNGIATDEHAYEPHRHTDKALLHYCSSHYADWAKEIPASAHHFKPGAFGENFFSEEVSEKNVCIGDRITIGNVLLEVTEPRAPCFKLNHRFEVKDMAKRSQTLMRTGWLYRVLTPGIVHAGDIIRLVERPYPEWSVSRVMYYLFIDRNCMDMNKKLSELEPLGEDIKSRFIKRVADNKLEDETGRWFGGESDKMDAWSEYRIVEKRRETNTVTAFVLEAIEDLKEQDITPVEPGSHVRLKLGGKLVRAYSVVGGTSKRFELGIALDSNSRGGSRFLHEETKVGDVITASRITTSFPLAPEADHHVIIAGGIGITSFMSALSHLESSGKSYELHLAVADEVPFASRLPPRAKVYRKAQSARLDLPSVFSQITSCGAHIYCCGPRRLMDGVRAAAAQFGVPEHTLHFEAFTVETSGDPFMVELKESGKVVEVGPMQSLLDALRAVGMDVDSSCEVGNCGTCRVDVCKGRVEHRGTGLEEDAKGIAMLSCVSRGVGRIVLDL
ncbi:PK beta-barrel-protein domain-containing protein-like protein [Corynespora cassiicola Philippines]|uniref:PK beta-barrel-protein domain-containing protein-like protein n=1 Tax=Corynespora cassiicola Philippines TaxID=1448308 RepID=A0A2T2PDE4_CORCC|nr:PK beta-barrel-protein domain-containing protein-like protein [Corynespora cassiicola Philippines]